MSPSEAIERLRSVGYTDSISITAELWEHAGVGSVKQGGQPVLRRVQWNVYTFANGKCDQYRGATLEAAVVAACDAREGAVGVGRATTEAVVIGSLFILVVNFFLTMTLNIFFPAGK